MSFRVLSMTINLSRLTTGTINGNTGRESTSKANIVHQIQTIRGITQNKNDQDVAWIDVVPFNDQQTRADFSYVPQCSLCQRGYCRGDFSVLCCSLCKTPRWMMTRALYLPCSVGQSSVNPIMTSDNVRQYHLPTINQPLLGKTLTINPCSATENDK